jgi:hypothetical protein
MRTGKHMATTYLGDASSDVRGERYKGIGVKAPQNEAPDHRDRTAAQNEDHRHIAAQRRKSVDRDRNHNGGGNDFEPLVQRQY